jgi:hypothetical protein
VPNLTILESCIHISSYDEWFNAKYGNWFDDEKYDEQHQKWRGKPKIIGGFLSAHMPYFKRIEPI